MMDFRLIQLRSFVAVADLGHFGRAAEQLGVGQSAVSQHVQTIERAVGTPLLERTSRRVALNEAGDRFLPVARRLLRELDRVAGDARAIADGRLGTVRVAAQQAARACVVPRTLLLLGEQEPGLTVEVIPSTTAEGLDALQRGDVDVALVRDPSRHPGIISEHLTTDPTMVVLPADDPLADRAEIDLCELRDRPRIGWNRSGAPAYHDVLSATLADAGVDPTARYELHGVDSRLGAVAAGLGWALESKAYDWLMAGRVRFVAIAGTPLRGQLVIAWPEHGAAPGVPAFRAAAHAATALPAQRSAERRNTT